MGLAKRFSEALTSVRHFFRSGLQGFDTVNATVDDAQDHDSVANYRISDDSGVMAKDTEFLIHSHYLTLAPTATAETHSMDLELILRLWMAITLASL
jgi:hypothetical protein